MSINNVEIQDSNGNVYYPHTDASVVKFGNSDVGTALLQLSKDNTRTTTAKDITGAINELNSEKSSLVSPTFTGTPSAPTAVVGTNTTQLATTAFVTNSINNKTSITGNAATATMLATARTISLTGDVTGSVNFDGSTNADIIATVGDDSHAHTIGYISGLQAALDNRFLSHASRISNNTDIFTLQAGHYDVEGAISTVQNYPFTSGWEHGTLIINGWRMDDGTNQGYRTIFFLTASGYFYYTTQHWDSTGWNIWKRVDDGTDSGWITFLVNSTQFQVRSDNPDWFKLRCRKIGNRVFLSGHVQAISTLQVDTTYKIGTIPAGFCPTSYEYNYSFVCTGNSIVNGWIGSDGVIWCVPRQPVETSDAIPISMITYLID
ncbi:hypothetical protein CDLVIII_4352 [Clostridium sp. DL-VIII]|uniref:hypothetical protein n=1 Tax=Clostridium sp. DL-VIII TaxID=641107 RepID=UPI00023B059F|nr:hypothetical protein [Clostridium sp. DL-VIII]EHJ00866.1 hypothetical protein CDLVIII_4352 [Clostridium sp. DL-VIII]